MTQGYLESGSQSYLEAVLNLTGYGTLIRIILGFPNTGSGAGSAPGIRHDSFNSPDIYELS